MPNGDSLKLGQDNTATLTTRLDGNLLPPEQGEQYIAALDVHSNIDGIHAYGDRVALVASSNGLAIEATGRVQVIARDSGNAIMAVAQSGIGVEGEGGNIGVFGGGGGGLTGAVPDAEAGTGVAGKGPAAGVWGAGKKIGVKGMAQYAYGGEPWTMGTGVAGVAREEDVALGWNPDSGTGVAGNGDPVGVSGDGTQTGVRGTASDDTGTGVIGTGGAVGVAGTGKINGVTGQSSTGTGTGVTGTSGSVGVAGTGKINGVTGQSSTDTGTGVTGTGGSVGVAGTGRSNGVTGTSSTDTGTGITGTGGFVGVAGTGTTNGVRGQATSVEGTGVTGTGGRIGVAALGSDCGLIATATRKNSIGVDGQGRHIGLHGRSTTNPCAGRPAFEAGVAGEGPIGVAGGGLIGVRGAALPAEGVNGRLKFGVVGLSDGAGGIGIVGSSNFVAGLFLGHVVIEGDMMVHGVKSAALAHPDGSHRLLYAIESPECWFEDFGTGKLIRGRGKVKLEPHFAAVVRTDKYHVFITPEGDSKGLYVTAKSKTGFEVREQQAGKSSLQFSYRIAAKRKDIPGERFKKVKLPDTEKIMQTVKRTSKRQLGAKK